MTMSWLAERKATTTATATVAMAAVAGAVWPKAP